MKKVTNGSTKLVWFTLLTLISLKLFAQDDYYDDDENIDMKSSFIMALIGGGIFLVGRGLAEVKSLAGLAKVLLAIGAFVAFLGVCGIAMIILQAALNIALKIAIVIGAIILAGWIIKGIVNWFNKDDQKV
jgi:hypothetical protein